MERFIPVECFRKKGKIPVEVFLFLAFTCVLLHLAENDYSLVASLPGGETTSN